MPNYKYRAVNPEGKTIESVVMAADRNDVFRQLHELHMVPIDVKEVQSKKRTDNAKVNIKDTTIIHFSKQLYTLLKAGLPIVASLKAVREQTSDEGFKDIIENITNDIEQGSKFSDALNNYPKVFPSIFINSIKIGEVSGTLEETLEYLFKFLEEDSRIRKQVKKAFRYPLFVTIGIIGAFIVFTTMVIPSFIPMFEATGAELPLPTRILIGIHDLIANYGILVLLALIGLGVSVYFYIRTPNGKFQKDQLTLELPIFGEFTKKVNVSRFAKLFYTMNKTGINITKTFQIMQETMENSVYNKELEIVAEKIIKGQEIAVSLQQSKYFTPLICEMVSIGEKSGALDEMLFNVSEYYSREVSDTVDNMTSLIEPILTIVMGGMVLLLALSMLMPMLDMMNIL